MQDVTAEVPLDLPYNSPFIARMPAPESQVNALSSSWRTSKHNHLGRRLGIQVGDRVKAN
jgi:hypothetical protein